MLVVGDKVVIIGPTHHGEYRIKRRLTKYMCYAELKSRNQPVRVYQYNVQKLDGSKSEEPCMQKSDEQIDWQQKILEELVAIQTSQDKNIELLSNLKLEY
jgi:16S rRNA G1207 methylase RsmC